MERDQEENQNYVRGENMPARAQEPTGYILSITFHYPENFHHRNNDLPHGPDTFQLQAVSLFNAEHYIGEAPSPKLIAHLAEHNFYVFHYMEAQEIVRQGGVITKIHKILEFNQEAFARDIVIFNVDKRIIANKKNDEFGK